MLKRPFLAFVLIVSVLIAGSVWFIRSARFATLLRDVAARYIPSDLGVHADFTGLSVKLFPPGISIENPRITLNEKNITNLPADSSVTAERVDLIFRPLQMLSGTIRIRRVVVVGGDVTVHLDRNFLASSRARSRHKGFGVRWDELLQINAETVALENTRVHLKVADPEITIDLLARELELGQWTGVGGLGYRLALDLKDVRSSFPKSWRVPALIDGLRGRAVINAAGLTVTGLDLEAAGVHAAVNGEITGNLLKSQRKLTASAKVRLNGELPRVFAALGLSRALDADSAGRLAFDGKVRLDPLRPMETLHAEGEAEVLGARYRGWHADSLKVDGSWSAGAGGGEVLVSKAIVTSAKSEKRGGNHPGDGGRVEAGPFRLKLGSHDLVQIPLMLTEAHIHWLGAGVLKDVYPLDFRASGPVQLTITPSAPKRPWEIGAQLKLTVSPFRLDNQKLGLKRPLKRVLDVPQLTVEGGVAINASQLRPLGLNVILPRSHLAVGGDIDFHKGFDLRADGPIQLEDLGQLAENVIRGTGKIAVHVHGPTRAVVLDFDTDIQNAYYLKLKLGDLKGRVTWDDDPDHLVFTGIHVQRDHTSYTAQGLVDLGPAQSIKLGIRVTKGQVHDFSGIFDDLTAKLWWYPRQLVGAFEGTIQVSGGIDLDRLRVEAHLNGSSWEYLGEKFRKVTLSGGYDRGTYSLDSLSAIKRGGSIHGQISFDTHDRFNWDFKTEGMSIVDLDTIARLDVPIRGSLLVASRGQGKIGDIQSVTQVSFSNASVRGEAVPESDLTIKSADGALGVRAWILGGQGRLDARYDFEPGRPCYARGSLHELDFTPVLLLLNPKSIQDHELAGRISGALDLKFRAGQVELASGTVSIDQYLLSRTGSRFELVEPVQVKLENGTFDLPSLAVRGPQGSQLKLTVQARDARIEGGVTGTLDASIIEFLTSAVANASGTIQVAVDLGGKIKEPKVFGHADLSGAAVRVASLDSPIENITGRLDLKQNVITLENLEGDLANGRVLGSGSVTLFPDRVPAIDLNGTLTGNRIKVYPFQFAKVSGTLHVHGQQLPYVVDGNIKVDSALCRENMMNQGQARQLKSARFMPSSSLRREGDFPLFKLNIDAHADSGILVQNDLFDAELKGKVTVVNTIDAPRILGTADLIQGRMSFKDRVFQIQSANVSFDNPAVINPQFSLVATTEVSGTKIQVYASGRMDKYKIELSSNPAMPQSEILSLLALGLTSDEVRKLSSGDRGAFEQGEAFGLLLHSLDFNRDIQNRTGFEIQLDEAVNNQNGTSVFRPRNEASDVTSAPKIVIKRRIGKKVNLSVGSTVGVGASSQQEVNAEWNVTPGFSVLGVWDNLDSTGAQNRGSYGVDLKLQTRFK